MLRPKKGPNSNALGGRRAPRPQTELLFEEYNYERYSRPLSTIFPESLHRCLKELNHKDQSSAQGICRPSRPNTRFYTSHNADGDASRSPENMKKAVFPGLDKKKVLGYWSKTDSKSGSTKSPQSFLASPGSSPTPSVRSERRGVGNVRQNGKTGKLVLGGRLEHWSHLARSLPSLLTQFQKRTKDHKADNRSVGAVVERDLEYSPDDDHSNDEVGMEPRPKVIESRISIVSNTPTIYEEPWDTEKALNKWMRVSDCLEEAVSVTAS